MPPRLNIARVLVDGKFEFIPQAEDTILKACRNAAIFVPGNCTDGSCRDCTVEIELTIQPGVWKEVLACKHNLVDCARIKRKNVSISPKTCQKVPSWNSRLEKVKLSKFKLEHQRTLQRSQELASIGETYSRTTGVELKFDIETEIDWDRVVSWTDTDDIVKRCMAKYPDTVPAQLSSKDLVLLVIKLPNFQGIHSPDSPTIARIVEMWAREYSENLERVTFQNVSSYEP